MGIEGVRGTVMNIRNIETVYSGRLNNSNGCIYTCYHTHTRDKYAARLSVLLSRILAWTNDKLRMIGAQQTLLPLLMAKPFSILLQCLPVRS